MVEEAELMFWIAEKLKNHNLWLHSRSRTLPGRAVDVFLKSEFKKIQIKDPRSLRTREADPPLSVRKQSTSGCSWEMFNGWVKHSDGWRGNSSLSLSSHQSHLVVLSLCHGRNS